MRSRGDPRRAAGMSHCHRRRHLRLAISIRATHELSHRDLAGIRRPGPHGHEEMDSTLPDLARHAACDTIVFVETLAATPAPPAAKPESHSSPPRPPRRRSAHLGRPASPRHTRGYRAGQPAP
ncbi:hypothetical protein FRAHR75_1160006 [Frankia sp. Hr75.2]|nr:hypothetical protein FRAHR75_1160006 [Frankia sp. Hr75.2]